MIRVVWRTFSATVWAAIAACVLLLFALGWSAVTAPGQQRQG